MMLKMILPLGLLFMSGVWAASVPQSSRYDRRIQNVTYNSQNATEVNTRPGYLTTLLFDNDEQVIDAQTGFAKGWTVTKNGNRVDVSPTPISQPVTDAPGNSGNQVFLPTGKDWNTNLIVVTSKRVYSMDLRVLDQDTPTLAFIIRYHYPDDARQTAASTTQQKAGQEEKQRIAAAFSRSGTARNWDYTKRVAAHAAFIAPDFVYDDGRFTYLGFSSTKTLPAPFVVVNGQEQVVTPGVTEQGRYTVLTLRALSPQLVLRYGHAVVGIENSAFGKTPLNKGDTVSPDVELEAK